MSFRFPKPLVAWLLMGCGGEPEPAGDVTTVPPDPCSEPLTLAPDRPGVPTLEGTRFRAEGTGGTLTFRFVENLSGALLQASTGEYVAGAAPYVVDVVEVVDERCDRTTQAEVAVWEPMALVPERALVPPGTTFAVTNQGGSGAPQCAWVTEGSGGVLEGCQWTAGERSGVDVIEVTDPQTFERGTVQYEVEAGATLRVVGERLYLPLGHPFALTVEGGTQSVEVSVPSGLTLEPDGRLVGDTEGVYEVQVADTIATSLSTTVPVEVRGPRTVDLPRDGEGTEWADVVTGDFDGDGFVDAVVSSMELSVGAHFSGGVHIYAGSEDGRQVDPVATYSVSQTFAFAGRSIAVGDLDGDGQPDLALGSGWLRWRDPSERPGGRVPRPGGRVL